MGTPGGDWVGDFAGDWQEPPPPPVQAKAPPGGRETVEIVICPRCRARDVRCTKRTTTHSHWSCAVCFHGWKEGPEVGQARGWLA